MITKNISQASELIRNGKLVSFPTETVYGLGANIYNINAVQNIFKTKGRPSTNPVIIHTYSLEKALELFDFSEKNNIKDTIMKIGFNFWPGPLTIVYKANPNISDIITASSGYVGVRIPNNELALQFLKTADVPIAAPSANKSGHISPTDVKHVYDEFKDDEVTILDGGDIRLLNNGVGIESTIIKLDTNKITILRSGGISYDQINTFIREEKLPFVLEEVKKMSNLKEGEIAPGQSITHYAPKNIDTYMIKTSRLLSLKDFAKDHADIAILDFGKYANIFSGRVAMYLDLSEEQKISQAMLNLYNYLRLIEDCKAVKKLYIITLTHNNNSALNDRIVRAASGKIVDLFYEKIEI
ncbi:Telomere recombination [seawater metagenome]|uniref:Threonylcarbamoyl-AMP synthase n=1 Tax=seawater metagenome TaxID=1561972 RepID=A0A5E8CGX6_9ZZZZ